MGQVHFDRWVLDVDRTSTEEAYRRIAPGPETCGCSPRRNFAAVRERVYPPEFRRLCGQLGIQVEKECEVYHCGQEQDGEHVYGGWFHFVGRVGITPENEDHEYTDAEGRFRFYFSNRPALVPEVLRERPLVQVEFTLRAPWVLNEPEPD